MSSQQFMQMLFGKLPDFFKDETELRTLWSRPDTRSKLLHGLAEKGFGAEQMDRRLVPLTSPPHIVRIDNH